ncbi:glycosyltransferase [Methylobacterium pseudosasicola]|uniref:Uncharacterized protein n=1 Tax=Methylobacterium pseudosasicola TaxID=582667 RepID=A0A1I4TRY3_9HYPH|nr:glycosyltransferase [Methylobacterium pseudosasicola]SFM79504.1 hypothetical protein SAMN05192568_10582 [Methylobacterium pseudosasicola]
MKSHARADEDAKNRYGADYATEFCDLIQTFAATASTFLEWGSGETTKLLCQIAETRPAPFVLTIDHNLIYQKTVAELLPRYEFLHLRCFDLQGPSYCQADTFPSYSSYPKTLGLTFDVVLVDGRRRVECALVAFQILSENGIVLLHDYRRTRYAPMMCLFETVYAGNQFLVLRQMKKLLCCNTRSSFTMRRRYAVAVTVRGERAQREFDLTHTFTKQYAASIEADFFVVGENSSLPVHRLKSVAAELLHTYDRLLLLDADVVIRPQAPNIFDVVPDNMLGAYPEGLFFPRKDWCSELNVLYELTDPIQEHEYFNSGVLVISQQHVALLESLGTDVVFGHPQFEQGFLNIKRKSANIPLYALSQDFNFIPNTSVQPTDWRYAFFYHLAGSGKGKRLHTRVWSIADEWPMTYTKRDLTAADTRVTLIREVCLQIVGVECKVFDASDFYYNDSQAFPLINAAGVLIARFPEKKCSGFLELAVFGPYCDLRSGRWRLQYFDPDGVGLYFPSAELEVSSSATETIIISRRPWPEDGIFEFYVEEKIIGVEFKIFRRGQGVDFENVRLTRVAD